MFCINSALQRRVYESELATRLSCVGEFFDAPLGNVYAEDKDDWDVENKTFAFVDTEQERFFKYANFYFYILTGSDNSFWKFNR